MGWESRGSGGPYYYRKTRDAQGRVVSTYLGNGVLAHLIAQLDAAGRAITKYRQAALARFGTDVDKADVAVRDSTEAVRARLGQALEERGYRYHRGDWRRPRTSGPSTAKTNKSR